ncbi:MAG: hypothetical protein OSB44_09200, partial [Verrucomicrobiales bacterium]|nr:hypothetical protein [Verrucomicrobiales bacterium]
PYIHAYVLENFLIIIAFNWIIVTILWLISLKTLRADFIDVYWGPSFFSATRMVNHGDYPDSWVETGPIFLFDQVASFGCYVSSWSGKRHDGRHLMRRIDFSNPTKPVLLKEVDVPGLLKHVYTTKSRGTVLFTTRQKLSLTRQVWSDGHQT